MAGEKAGTLPRPNDPAIVKAERNFTKERDDLCIPIAKKIIAILGQQEDLLLGSSASGVSEEDVVNYYSNLYVKEIGPLLLENNVKADHVKYIFTLVRQAVQFMTDRTEMTIEHHYNSATALKWGVKDTDEIDLNMIQEVLVAAVPADASADRAEVNAEPSAGVDNNSSQPEKK